MLLDDRPVLSCLVLGVECDLAYQTQSFRLAPGAALLLYTDGVPDAVSVKVGGKVEVYVLRTAFALATLAAVGYLLAPVLLHLYATDNWLAHK